MPAISENGKGTLKKKKTGKKEKKKLTKEDIGTPTDFRWLESASDELYLVIWSSPQ